MSLRRFNARRDENEPELIDALEACGFAVSRLSGPGIPDLAVSRRHHWHMVEIKTASGREKPAQREFRGQHKAPVHMLRTVDDVLSFAKGAP